MRYRARQLRVWNFFFFEWTGGAEAPAENLLSSEKKVLQTRNKEEESRELRDKERNKLDKAEAMIYYKICIHWS